MKKFYFSICCLAFLAQATLTAQTNYQSVFTSKTHWEMYRLDEKFNGQVVQQQTTKDTTFGGFTYKVIADKTDVSSSKQIFIRENASEKKIYAFDEGKEFTLYDFNLKVGDKFSVKQWEFEVVNVGVVATSEGERKSIELKPISKAWDNMVWIEGLGSMVGPIYYQNYGKIEESYQVTCFFRDKVLVYSASDWNCVSPFSTTSIKSPELLAKAVMVAPNPFQSQFRLMVSNPSGGDVKISITTLTGIQIYEEEFEKAGERLETTLGWSSDIYNGLLLLHVQTSEGQIIKRIVKN